MSVLFADLVGHTAFSEGRDVEEVRDLLGRYFDEARTIVERYGGEVEKFIGDAVMAVWGAPAAREDDAERAVRAALDLVPAVSELGAEFGEPSLMARAAVLTGEAAVTVGARGQGMVAGDLVNTASRVQGLAEPGTVLVGEATRRATDRAISYAEVGDQELKGKSAPVRLWHALRVAGSGGSGSELSEPPFVGRERELRLLKELFHASADESRAHLVSTVGIAGIGKSRLARELERYLDGVAQGVLWHRGRCLAYGEGVTFAALAEMIRMRAGIAESDDAESARERLRRMLERYMDDASERDFVEPRLAQLLAIEQEAVGVAEVFAGWRLFLERLAEHSPLVLVFEDMQWADAPLLEFLEYLLDWSRGHRVFVVALARPELAERHPGWGSSLRNSATILLEPLPAPAMEDLLEGYVPGLPEGLQRQIIDRAEGVPLYAVETVRMLLDRDLIERQADGFVATGKIDELQVPETLQALVAARIDDLADLERRLVRDAALIGKTFPRDLLVAVTEVPDDRLDAALDALVRKEILSLDADPRSPERGMYAFVQDLLRQVAYETLARGERKRGHLAAAGYLERTLSDELEPAEIVSAHYLAALELAPDADDAQEIAARASTTLVKAAERADSLAAPESAKRYYERALELTSSPLEAAELHERAGMAAARSEDAAEARVHYEQAIAGFDKLGFPQHAARVAARLAVEVTWQVDSDIERAVADLQAAFEVLVDGEPNPELAMLAVQSARPLFFSGRIDEATARNELGLQIGETLLLTDVIAEGLNTKGLILNTQGRHQEAELLARHSLSLAVANDLSDAALRAYGNLAASLCNTNRFREALELSEAGVAQARKFGHAGREAWLQMWRASALADLGEWDTAVALEDEVNADELWSIIWIHVERGEHAKVEALLSKLERTIDVNELQERVGSNAIRALILQRAGDSRQALAFAEAVWQERHEVGMQVVAPVLWTALEAAFDLGDRAKVDALLVDLGELSPGDATPMLRALGARFHAKCAALDHDRAASTGFATAARLLREIETPFALAVVLLEHGTWLSETGQIDEARPLLDEAREIFERLKAEPWLERMRARDTKLQPSIAD